MSLRTQFTSPPILSNVLSGEEGHVIRLCPNNATNRQPADLPISTEGKITHKNTHKTNTGAHKHTQGTPTNSNTDKDGWRSEVRVTPESWNNATHGGQFNGWECPQVTVQRKNTETKANWKDKEKYPQKTKSVLPLNLRTTHTKHAGQAQHPDTHRNQGGPGLLERE